MSSINQTVEIYGQKVTNGALIVAVLGSIFGLVLILNGFLVAGIVTLITYSVASYTINCVVLGECNKWAIFLTLGNSLMIIISLYGLLTTKTNLKKK